MRKRALVSFYKDEFEDVKDITDALKDTMVAVDVQEVIPNRSFKKIDEGTYLVTLSEWVSE